MPNAYRPPAISSSVAAILAASAGCRYGLLRTACPMPILEVTAATAATIDTLSQTPMDPPSSG
jgi:hypothetical protein